jgi:hypothetical protein
VCALANCQWCGEPCFAGAAISLDGICRKIPGGAGISHYRPNQGFVADPPYIAWDRIPKKTLPHCCAGSDPLENNSSFHCCVHVRCHVRSSFCWLCWPTACTSQYIMNHLKILHFLYTIWHLKITVVKDVMRSRMIWHYQHFRGNCHLHLQHKHLKYIHTLHSMDPKLVRSHFGGVLN